METTFKLRQLPKFAKLSITGFILALAFGYITGLMYVDDTTKLSLDGIEENYNGNSLANEPIDDDTILDWDESLEMIEPMRFKKSKQELITIIHTHVISFALIFLSLSFLIYFTSTPIILKKILLIEPFISIVLTFGGIWLLWLGLDWLKYIIMISGSFLTISFILLSFFILIELIKK
ncbi:MAG: hypothetical protein P8M12_03620 [Flavobacteriales bacterium]|nr:hypothetical protein [Flavobacteriales bacterium]